MTSPFAGGGGGVGSGADDAELEDEEELGQDQEEEGGLGEGDDDTEADRLTTLEQENERLRREVGQLEELKGRQGQALGEYRRRYGGGGARDDRGAYPPEQGQYPGTGREQLHPIVEAYNQTMITGDPRILAEAVDRRIVTAGQGLARFLETRSSGEASFFRAHPELVDGMPREVFDGRFAKVLRDHPGISEDEARDIAASETQDIVSRMGQDVEWEGEDAKDAARKRRSTPPRGARRPGGPSRPRTQQEVLDGHTAQYLQDETRRSQTQRRPTGTTE